MSKLPESELDIDLQFLPAWAQSSSAENKYAKYKGDEGSDDRRRRGDRSQRRRGPDGGNRSGGGGGRRPQGQGQGQGQGRRDGRGERRFDGGRASGDGRRPRRRTEDLPPLPDLKVILVPEKRGVESIVKQIKLTGRAYPIFDIANLILKKTERFVVRFESDTSGEKKGQTLHVCDLDNSVWLSQAEAVAHVLNHHLETFYQSEKIPTDPPKGTYTFVAQCSMSGKILGPPNWHDYQTNLRQLHKERFSKMAFETFKSRVKIVRDEEVVQKWIDDQSFKTEYTCLNVPEPKKLESFQEVEAHFRETHMAAIIKEVKSATAASKEEKDALPRQLKVLLRRAIDEQKRFPLKTVHQLSQQFAGHSLQFFKIKKSITHVSVARPRHLDMNETPVTEGIRKIVDYVADNKECNRRLLLEALAPSPALESTPAGEAAEGDTAKAEAVQPTPEQQTVMTDLHWLIHEGHVIEYSSGVIELAPKPEPKPEPKKKQPKAEAPKAEAPKAEEPKAEAPKAEEPKAEEPKAEEPKAEEPKADA